MILHYNSQCTEQQRQRGSRKLFMLALMLVFGLTASITAQDAPLTPVDKTYPIDLYTTLRLAGQQNLRVAEAEARVREASGDLLSSYERFLPTLSADIVFLKHTGLTQGTEGEFVDVTKQSSRFGGALTASWNLNDALFAALSSRQKKRASEDRLLAIRERSMQEAAFAYFDLVETSRLKRVAENSIEISSALVIQADSAVNTGVASGLDLLRARGLLNRDSLLWLRSDEDANAASARLAQILNLDQSMNLVPLDTSVGVLSLVDTAADLETWLVEASDGNPRIVEQRNQVRSFQWEKRQATWGGLLPEISAGINRTGFGQTFSDLRDSKDYQISARWILGTGGLFDLGHIRTRAARLDAAEIHLEIVQDSVRERVISFYESLKNRGRMLEIAQRALNDAERLLQLLRERQTVGVSRSLEVVLAAEEYEGARIEYLQKLIDYNKAQVLALHAIGKLSKNGVND